MQDAQDASGLMFRRNRYYDPASGRFTQEDPIGLAGGLNAYGFAGGDPVNYSDPYGLKADGCNPPGSCLAKRAMQGGTVGLAGGGVLAVACSAGTLGACALGPAELTALVTTGAGVTAGAAYGTGEELGTLLQPAIDAGVHQMGRLGRWVRRGVRGAVGSILIGIGVTTKTPTTESASGDVPEAPAEPSSQGRRTPKKESEGQRPPN